ncbi:MAG: hypothetical protein H0U76_06885 [Ktedonobacteraceae bacterium]|nr:hypothetical protein [Ktedonobacteraceae bacterium]MBA3824126.1 hypothetical protein [Ktedonobacterales bacterium]
MADVTEQILELLFTLAEPNDSEWGVAFASFFSIASTQTLPVLIDAFWDRGATRPYWEDEVEGWCIMLYHAQRTLSKSDFIEQCIPTLIGLLYIQKGYKFDPSMVMEVLKLFDLSGYSYIIPALIQTVRYNWGSDAVTDARELLKRFSLVEFQPYQSLLASLESL